MIKTLLLASAITLGATMAIAQSGDPATTRQNSNVMP